MASESDVGPLPHWDLSNIYPDLESKEFKEAVSELKDKLDDLDAYMSKHQISRGGPRPTRSMELAEVIGGCVDRMNALLRLFGTLESYVYGFVSTDSYNTTAKRLESELEVLGVRLERQGVFFQGWIAEQVSDE
jgi:oligoendopeptidase F